MSNNQYYPQQPYYRETVPQYSEPIPTPAPNYSGVYGPYMTERERLLERQVAQAEGKAKAFELQYRDSQNTLLEAQRRLTRWQLNIRTSIIAFLSLFIVVWGTVSILVQYPVLPWNMPSAIIHLFGH